MTPIEQLKKDLQDTRESLLRTTSSVSRFSSIRERYYTDRANECAAQLAAVEALEQELAEFKAADDRILDLCKEYYKGRVEALEAENAKLRAALEPFADEARQWSTNVKLYPDITKVYASGFNQHPAPALFNLGDLRRAAQVLAETNARKEDAK